MRQRVILGAVGGLALAAGLAGGYGIGSATASSTATSPSPVAVRPNSGADVRSRFGRRFERGVAGTVAAVQGDTIQVRTTSGQTAVLVGPSTVVSETLRTTMGSVRVGECVRALGPSSSTGEVSARTLLLSPPGPAGCSARSLPGTTGRGATNSG